MDINLFRKALASKTKKLTEASTGMSGGVKGSSTPHLRMTNHQLDQGLVAIERAIGYYADFLEIAVAKDELSPEEKRQTQASIKELENLLKQLEKASDKIPTV